MYFLVKSLSARISENRMFHWADYSCMYRDQPSIAVANKLYVKRCLLSLIMTYNAYALAIRRQYHLNDPPCRTPVVDLLCFGVYYCCFCIGVKTHFDDLSDLHLLGTTGTEYLSDRKSMEVVTLVWRVVVDGPVSRQICFIGDTNAHSSRTVTQLRYHRLSTVPQ